MPETNDDPMVLKQVIPSMVSAGLPEAVLAWATALKEYSSEVEVVCKGMVHRARSLDSTILALQS